MLGRRKIIDSKAGPYVWITYGEAYDSALRISSAIRSRGVNPLLVYVLSGRPVWHIWIQLPGMDNLNGGPNSVEFVINHAEVSIAFVQESKIPAMLTCLPEFSSYLKTIVSFGEISSIQKKEAEDLGVSCFSWKEFALLGCLDHELPSKQRTDICTIMIYDRIYTGAMGKIPSGGTLKKTLFQYAYNFKLGNLEKGLKQDEAAPLLDKFVFNKVLLRAAVVVSHP
ncbi:hypothetical protein Vadar_018346 [Vaccinium darrowii]|uniref:Uncharacterized protein n=1 Tax=Vaccinium darrowii TaxID=229202 RepID=A0ACB7X1L5_9ERIC|nr:hypothetical protein Vadar_018346 [Vaccinium darrowii]